MTRKHFIELARHIKAHNTVYRDDKFTILQLETLVDALRACNLNFNAERWIGFIRGVNGPSGGKP